MEIDSDQDPRVLLVEDELLVRMMGRLIFSGAGFGVLEAADADEAWELLESGRLIHLLFTDIHVPGLFVFPSRIACIGSGRTSRLS
jgi:CheY-like chemotaxis protein